ncbi:uncharacterized protein FA14DRAFT_182583 [Meira miltonrushii]|uniref:Uncharacterized protein n=1 Tax=Meira miltonrushii TaxID=1280837 RepID=A0A316V2V4_9BASI|nr:uncharacterized protein FA14DRAFT_182583 [Meira miltonrushii]PWN31792.1 hypothetical protein FA14DRAFT_182583 [Meira miltonrushii]
MSSSRSHIMKHANNSGSVRFHPSVEEIESKGGGEDNEPGYRSSSYKELKPISGRRATGYTPATDDLEDERRQIRQLMSERKINYNQHSSRNDRNLAKKKELEVNNAKDISRASMSDHSEISATTKQLYDQPAKHGFGAKLVCAMRFVKKHDHAGHDMDQSVAKRSGLNHRKSSIELGSEDEFEPVEKGTYMTAPSLTEAFAPIFADGHGMFLPSTAREGNPHNFHKNLASLPKGNSSFAAIVETAVQKQVVGGEGRMQKKLRRPPPKRHEDTDASVSEEDLEKILSEAVRERIHVLAASAKRRVRDSMLKIADSMEEPEGDTPRKPSFDQERQKISHGDELPRRTNSRKGMTKVHYKADDPSDYARRHEGRERKQVNDEPLAYENDGIVDAKTAFKIVESERHRNNGNAAVHSDVIWIGRDGHQIDDPTTKKSRTRQRQLTKMPVLDGTENAAVHDEPLAVERVQPEPIHKSREARAERHYDHHGRPSMESVRSEPQYRSTHDRSRSRHKTRLSEDNVVSEHLNRASEDSPRSHGSTRRHRSRHERPHRSREPSLEEKDLSQLDRARMDEISHRHQRKAEEKEKERMMTIRVNEQAEPVKSIIEREKLLNDSHAIKQAKSEETDHIEPVEKSDEVSTANSHHKFRSLRALGHAIALGNSMHGGRKTDHKTDDVLDPEASEAKDHEGSEHANGDVQHKFNKFVDAHGETRLNEALDIAKMMMEQELLDVKAEKRRHQTTVAALDPNADQKGVKGAFKAVKNVTGHLAHHDGGGIAAAARGTRSKAERSMASATSEQQSFNPSEDAYEQALRNEIKSKKERIKTSHFINDQNFGINGLI